MTVPRESAVCLISCLNLAMNRPPIPEYFLISPRFLFACGCKTHVVNMLDSIACIRQIHTSSLFLTGICCHTSFNLGNLLFIVLDTLANPSYSLGFHKRSLAIKNRISLGKDSIFANDQVCTLIHTCDFLLIYIKNGVMRIMNLFFHPCRFCHAPLESSAG